MQDLHVNQYGFADTDIYNKVLVTINISLILSNISLETTGTSFHNFRFLQIFHVEVFDDTILLICLLLQKIEQFIKKQICEKPKLNSLQKSKFMKTPLRKNFFSQQTFQTLTIYLFKTLYNLLKNTDINGLQVKQIKLEKEPSNNTKYKHKNPMQKYQKNERPYKYPYCFNINYEVLYKLSKRTNISINFSQSNYYFIT
eukprot:TRINITY_DN28906_c0_g2_i1.p1 TRINITY_DN28906_c0_g2~~TRINITY_DN28906_c0_g2_i1.p1  ORF type:complete len:199 (+),score=-1.72 TRINITY_DN28906_c0_g2_i1:377-973(+)